MENKSRIKKFFISIRDEKFQNNRQCSVVNILNTEDNVLVNQYGKIYTTYDLGDFDVTKKNDVGNLNFFPFDERINDYSFTFSSFDTLQDVIQTDYLELGDLCRVGTYYTSLSGSTSEISSKKVLGISSYFTSSKILIDVSTEDGLRVDSTEINLINDKIDIHRTEYGKLFYGNSLNNEVGLGTYSYSLDSNKNVELYFTPSNNYSETYILNASVISIATTEFTNPGEYILKYGQLESSITSIASSTNPVSVPINFYIPRYQSAYYVVEIKDIVNSQIQLSEIIVVNNNTQSVLLEYGSVYTDGPLGEFSTTTSTTTELKFKPNPNISVQCRLFRIASSIFESTLYPDTYFFGNGTIKTGISRFGFGGTGKFKTDFELLYKGLPIFKRIFDATNPDIVSTDGNTIYFPNHYFVTGEKVEYISDNINTDSTENSISIASTSINGIGVTNKLPKTVYIYKVDSSKISLCASASDALKTPFPKVLDFTSVAIGNTEHYINSVGQNTRSLILIDNVIQSPLVSTSTTTTNKNLIDVTDQTIIVEDSTGIYSEDLIKINDEIMKVVGVGIGSMSELSVLRPFLGTVLSEHPANSLVKKMRGNYNIQRNVVYFSQPPYGPLPFEKEDLKEETDWTGLQTKSTFQGRVFMRSGVPDTDVDTYSLNLLFDDVSQEFTGITSTFVLKNNNQNVLGISTYNPIVLINNIFQSPEKDYKVLETGGQSQLKFSGIATASILGSDVNISPFPRGGLIVSIASTNGFGYQPLVSAGGTATVSIAGTISKISIGNSGSGYRSGLQNVGVGIQTYSGETPNIRYIGNAIISDGIVVGVSITNPGFGYTFTNPPLVVFDKPLSYDNIPLIYSHGYSGIGTEAKATIVVGQESSVIDFEIKNYGYSYLPGQKLTVSVGGTVGIPTFSDLPFSDFELTVDKVLNDDFTSWYMGQFQQLDDFSKQFNGRKLRFTLTLNGERFSIIAKKQSVVETKFVILIFINNILQKPGKDYIFNNGSTVLFSEAPKEGDTLKVLFYRGTPEIDVKDIDILETVKEGDLVQLKSDVQKLNENIRTVYEILSPDAIETNVYSDVGISNDPRLVRPITWTKQREDIFIDNVPVTKNRIIYQPELSATSNIIQTVTVGSTFAYVDSIRTFFDNLEEDIFDPDRKIVDIISQQFGEGDPTVTQVERVVKCEYDGDFGLIVGVSTGYFGPSYGMYLDTFITLDSRFRLESITGTAKTISSLNFGDYFVIKGSNVGNTNGVISLRLDNTQIGVGTQFIDNIYQVENSELIQTNVVGVGTTTVNRIFVRTIPFEYEDIIRPNGFYGFFTWGWVDLQNRKEFLEFRSYFENGITGIDTSPVIRRVKPLKFLVA